MIRISSCSKENVVGYVPQNISEVFSLYLSLPHCYLELEVTGKRVNRVGGYGLKIPARSRFYGPEKTTQWL